MLCALIHNSESALQNLNVTEWRNSEEPYININEPWQVLKLIPNKEHNDIICVTDGNLTYDDDKDISREFNKFYVNKHCRTQC